MSLVAMKKLLLFPDLVRPNIHVVHCNHRGCQYACREEYIKEHQEMCWYRAVPCPHWKCDLLMPANKILDHIYRYESCHPRTKWRRSDQGILEETFLFKSCFDSNIHWELSVHSYRDEEFIVRFARNKSDGFFYAWLHLVGSKSFAEQFSCTITVIRQEDRTEYRSRVFALDHSEEEVFSDPRVVRLSDSLVKSCLQREYEDIVLDSKYNIILEYKVVYVGRLNHSTN